MFSESSRIYVAGHSGLLGRALLKILKKERCCNVITRNRAELDLTDQRAVYEFFRTERPEFVFLAAGLTGGIIANIAYPADFYHTNVSIQDNVFHCAEIFKAERVIFYGSSCMYPKNSTQPMNEECLLTGEIEKTSEAYAMAKLAGVAACKAYNNQYKTRRFIALVPNSMYGPFDNFDLERSHVIAGLLRKFHEAKLVGAREVTLWGTGTPRREFLYSEDAALASVFAVRNADRLENSHYNIGSGEDHTIKEIAAIISETVGFEGELVWNSERPDGAPRKMFDATRFTSLGWEPKTKLKDGIRMTYECYLQDHEDKELL